MGKDTMPLQGQRGTALVIALVLLLAVTLLSLAAVNTSILEMRMSSADEERMQIHQATDSAISYVMSEFPIYANELAENEVRCINLPAGCANGNAIDGSGIFATGDLNVSMTLVGSDLQPVRVSDLGMVDKDGNTFGAMSSDARRYEYLIEASLDRRSTKGGYAHLWRGYSRQVSTQSNFTSGDFVTCSPNCG